MNLPVLLILGAALCHAAAATPPVVSLSNQNVLFICIDDLRPELGCNTRLGHVFAVESDDGEHFLLATASYPASTVHIGGN